MSSAFIEFLIDFLALDYSEWLNTIYIHFIVHVKVFYQTLILVLEIYIMPLALMLLVDYELTQILK